MLSQRLHLQSAYSVELKFCCSLPVKEFHVSVSICTRRGKIVLKGDIRKFANALLLQMFIYHFASFQSQQNKQFYEITFGEKLGDGSCEGEVAWEVLCMVEIDSWKLTLKLYVESKSKFDVRIKIV